MARQRRVCTGRGCIPLQVISSGVVEKNTVGPSNLRNRSMSAPLHYSYPLMPSVKQGPAAARLFRCCQGVRAGDAKPRAPANGHRSTTQQLPAEVQNTPFLLTSFPALPALATATQRQRNHQGCAAAVCVRVCVFVLLYPPRQQPRNSTSTSVPSSTFPFHFSPLQPVLTFSSLSLNHYFYYLRLNH